MSYDELEMAMHLDESGEGVTCPKLKRDLAKYRKIRARNLHKMNSIPVFKKPK
jgi:hypothetical protein